MMTTWHTFNNYGYTLEKVPVQVMDILRVEREKYAVGDPISRTANGNLVGQINKEHDLAHLKETPIVKDFLLQEARTYAECFNLPRKPSDVTYDESTEWDICINAIWMNIQERGEYNPPHKHSGLMSFVIWFEIPYDISEEKALNNSKYSNHPGNGDFFFHPISTVGSFTSVAMNVGKDKEGSICVFDAKLLHSVNPFFTTDKQRVTFSGNFGFKELKK
jgi:hypothetical protein